ncbi:MAG: hypothetical protein R3C03_23420 [Pirellulaceae bacterium]
MTKIKNTLAAGNRKNLLDLLTPPDGYRLDWAIGTTYSLDFPALTAAMLAMLGVADGESTDFSPEAKLQAILRLRGAHFCIR